MFFSIILGSSLNSWKMLVLCILVSFSSSSHQGTDLYFWLFFTCASPLLNGILSWLIFVMLFIMLFLYISTSVSPRATQFSLFAMDSKDCQSAFSVLNFSLSSFPLTETSPFNLPHLLKMTWWSLPWGSNVSQLLNSMFLWLFEKVMFTAVYLPPSLLFLSVISLLFKQ